MVIFLKGLEKMKKMFDLHPPKQTWFTWKWAENWGQHVQMEQVGQGSLPIPRGNSTCVKPCCANIIWQTILHRCPDQPYETRFLLASLVHKRLNFSFFDNHFSIPQGNGVPQGGCQSPGLFAAVIDDLLADLHATWLRRGFHCVLPFSTAIMALAYMDDIYLLAPTLHQASLMLQGVSHHLDKKGLRLQTNKTQLMVSPNLQGIEPLPSDFDSLLQVKEMKVLGKMISFRRLSPEVPLLLSNGCSSWGAHREVLCCKDAPLKHRLHLFQQLVGEVILWCAAAILPLKSNLRKLNGLQFCLIATMLQFRRRTGEPWLDFQHRRYGKLALFRLSIPRWSTLLLKRIWTYAGHCSRQTAQGPWASAASVVLHTHTLQQWEHIRIHHRHPGRFTPVLRKWEESICRTLDTTDWHPTAQDRDRWRQSEAACISPCLWHTLVLVPTCPGRRCWLGGSSWWHSPTPVNSFYELCLWRLQQIHHRSFSTVAKISCWMDGSLPFTFVFVYPSSIGECCVCLTLSALSAPDLPVPYTEREREWKWGPLGSKEIPSLETHPFPGEPC